MGTNRSALTATRNRLAQLSRGTCYWKGCPEPITKDVQGEPELNVDLAHICGREEGSARYGHDPNLKDPDSVTNLILLCRAHHRRIDGKRRDEFSVTTLRAWKKEREGDTSPLVELGVITEERLGQLIAEANRGIRADVEDVLNFLAERDQGMEERLRNVLQDIGIHFPDEDTTQALSVASQDLLHTMETAPMLAQAADQLNHLQETAITLDSVVRSIRELGATTELLHEAATMLDRFAPLVEPLEVAATRVESAANRLADYG